MGKNKTDHFRSTLLLFSKTIFILENKMDGMPANTEETFYGNLVQSRIALPSGYPKDSPAVNARVAKVTGTYGGGIKIGPAIALKVMAGDKFNVQVNSWYKISAVVGVPRQYASQLLSP